MLTDEDPQDWVDAIADEKLLQWVDAIVAEEEELEAEKYGQEEMAEVRQHLNAELAALRNLYTTIRSPIGDGRTSNSNRRRKLLFAGMAEIPRAERPNLYVDDFEAEVARYIRATENALDRFDGDLKRRRPKKHGQMRLIRKLAMAFEHAGGSIFTDDQKRQEFSPEFKKFRDEVKKRIPKELFPESRRFVDAVREAFIKNGASD